REIRARKELPVDQARRRHDKDSGDFPAVPLLIRFPSLLFLTLTQTGILSLAPFILFSRLASDTRERYARRDRRMKDGLLNHFSINQTSHTQSGMFSLLSRRLFTNRRDCSMSD